MGRGFSSFSIQMWIGFNQLYWERGLVVIVKKSFPYCSFVASLNTTNWSRVLYCRIIKRWKKIFYNDFTLLMFKDSYFWKFYFYENKFSVWSMKILLELIVVIHNCIIDHGHYLFTTFYFYCRLWYNDIKYIYYRVNYTIFLDYYWQDQSWLHCDWFFNFTSLFPWTVQIQRLRHTNIY